jgi:hypothetical protein
MPPSWQRAAIFIGVLAIYLNAFWKVFRAHPGNKLVRCGIIALVVFAALLVLIRFPSVPQWLLNYVGLLLLSLCLLTMAFLFQRGYRAVRRWLWKSD